MFGQMSGRKHPTIEVSVSFLCSSSKFRPTSTTHSYHCLLQNNKVENLLKKIDTRVARYNILYMSRQLMRVNMVATEKLRRVFDTNYSAMVTPLEICNLQLWWVLACSIQSQYYNESVSTYVRLMCLNFKTVSLSLF